MMFHIMFEYADNWSGWKWRRQECVLEANSARDAIRKCEDLCGLGWDCEYNIISVEVVD